jgi:hypothetical protein
MKERLIGISIGIGACAALAVALGFRQDAPTTLAAPAPQETTYCWQLYSHVGPYYENGAALADLYLLDSCAGETWRMSQLKFEPVERLSK